MLKASGLAAGKGVLIPETIEEAIAGLKDIIVSNIFGDAGVFINSLNIFPSLLLILGNVY